MGMQSLLLVQGGGPTTVLNATLAGVLRECKDRSPYHAIYGVRSGMSGLPSADVLQLDTLSPEQLSLLARTPGAALGSSRAKLSEPDLLRACDTLRRLEIGSILFSGGNGTMRWAGNFAAFCRSNGLDLQVIGLPKTIDNDIVGTDRCPGFGSAARYVAQSLIDLTMDLRSLPQPISIVETLGRDVGWIAGASTLAKRDEADAPHVVCVPEIPFDLDHFVARLEAAVARTGWAVGVVSEGTRYADGRPVFEQTMPETAGKPNRPLIGGVAQFLSREVTLRTGLRCRSEKPGLLGRSAMPYVAPQDLRDAETVGREGVRALLRGETDHMVSLLPLSASADGACAMVPFSHVTVGSRALPPEWLSDDGLGVNAAFRAYTQEIVGDLDFYPVL